MYLIKYLIIIVCAFLPSIAFASTDNICFGCTDTNVDGVCDNGECGVNGAYITLTQWQTSASNLTDARTVNIYCKSGTCGSAGASVTISKTGSSATNTLTFIVDSGSRHDGKYNTSKYRLENNGSSGSVLTISTAYTTIRGFQVAKTNTSTGTGYSISIGADNVTIEENIIAQSGNTQTDFRHGIVGSSRSGIKIRNNILTELDSGGTAGMILGISLNCTGACDIRNNTIAVTRYASGTPRCMDLTRGTGSAFTIQNNICDHNYRVQSTGGTTPVVDHNVSTDGSLGTTGTPTYVASGTYDFHLASGDTVAKSQGVNLSGIFHTDVDGEERPSIWDVGADEIVSSGPSLLNLLNARGEN